MRRLITSDAKQAVAGDGMYFDNDWTPVSDQDRLSLCNYLDPVDGIYPVSPEKTIIARRVLTFYDTVQMIRLRDPDWEPKSLFIYYLILDGKLFRLNGAAPPIHEVNKLAPVRIDEGNCLDYLQFFCFFVRGDEGPFLIVQSMEDELVPKQLDPPLRTSLEKAIRPAVIKEKDAEGNIFVEATVYYSNAVFLADFKVIPGGMVEMRDDKPVLSDLPMKIDAPLT